MIKINKDKKKKVLILGGSSDIANDLIPKLINKDYQITAHYSSNSINVKKLKKRFNKIKFIKQNFYKITKKNLNKFLKKSDIKNNATLINLVGYVDKKTYQKTTLEQTLEAIKINTLIPNLIIRENLKFMKKIKYGRILNCSSIGVKFGGGDKTYNYSLSKHLLEFIPRYIKEHAKLNIIINNIRIGYTNTKIHKKIKNTNKLKSRIKKIPVGRAAATNEIANYISNFISKENSFITNETITIAGGE